MACKSCSRPSMCSARCPRCAGKQLSHESGEHYCFICENVTAGYDLPGCDRMGKVKQSGPYKETTLNGLRSDYPRWISTHSNEAFDRAQALANELTELDRRAGKIAPPYGYSMSRFKEAEKLVNESNQYHCKLNSKKRKSKRRRSSKRSNLSGLGKVETYRTFIRSARNWQEFARGRKTTVNRGLTWSEASRACKAYNKDRDSRQIAKGTMMEFEAE